MRLFFGILSALAICAWGFAYLYIAGLACAFSGPAGAQNCGIQAPWEMRGEDLVILVLIPGGIVILLLLATWLAGRGGRNG